MNKFLINFSRIAIGVSIGGGMAVGGYFVYKALHDNHDSKPYEPKIRIKDKELGFEVNEDYSKVPYLGEDGINKLIVRIKNDLGYGPEIMGLQSFNIIEGEYIPKDDNGIYIESTKQIFVNSTNMRKVIPQNGLVDSKVEIVFQIIYHEYGHYLSTEYVKNNKPNSTASTDTIYADGTNGRNISYWNKKFINTFKTSLSYDQVTKPLYNIKDVTTRSGSILHPLSSQYNVAQLFNSANGKNIQALSFKPDTFYGGLHYGTLSRVKPESIKYMYNMDELYARKYQQLGMVLKDNINFKRGWVEVNGRTMSTPFMQDTNRYQPDLTNIHGVANWRYASDAPYGINDAGNSKILYEAMREEFGQASGADISYIKSMNNSNMLDTEHFLANGNGRFIKFGGYIKTPYKYVGYMKNNKFVAQDIIVHDFTYKYKSSLQAANKDSLTPNGDNKFYITKDYIDGEEIKDHQLYFANKEDGSDKVAMTSTRNKEDGITSNYFEDAPEVLKDHYYEVEDNKGIIKIREGTWN